METLADRLRAAMAKAKITKQIELARAANVTRGAVSLWLSGDTKEIASKHLMPVASALGVSPEWLSSGKGPMQAPPVSVEGGDVLVWDKPDDLPADEGRVWVDRWDYSCSAGDGHIQWEIRQKSALPFTLAFFQAIGSKPENCKLLMVRGDSMEPFLFNRDMMMVDTSKTEIRDGLVYAVCFEHEPLVKRIYKQGGGVLVLNSYNSANYPDKTIDPAKAGQFDVIGEVVYRSGSGFSAS